MRKLSRYWKSAKKKKKKRKKKKKDHPLKLLNNNTFTYDVEYLKRTE